MKQETGENSDAFQARRDINITHQGMDYTSIKQLFFDLLSDNFPKLHEEAMAQANLNVIALAEELNTVLSEPHTTINPEKMALPDVQAALNDAVQGAAKKGKKADLNLLAKLVASRIDDSNSDLLDMTIEEAIRITPKLTKEHIHFLSIKHFVTHMTLTSPNVDFHNLESFAGPVLSIFGDDCEISMSNIQYLSGVGILDFNPIVKTDPYDTQFKTYPSLAENIQEFQEKIKVQAPSLHSLLNLCESKSFSSVNLNSFGQVIALNSLVRIFGTLDLKKWIN